MRKSGDGGKALLESSSGRVSDYALCILAISNWEVHGFLEVMAMDLVTAGLLYILSGKTEAGNQRGNACIFISGIRSVLSVLSQGKSGCFYLAGGIDSFHGQFVDRALQSAPWNRKIQKVKFFSRLGTGILWARDITGERFGQCSQEMIYPLMLMFCGTGCGNLYMESLLMLE